MSPLSESTKNLTTISTVVPKLESSDEWISWRRGVKDYLQIIQFGDVLTDSEPEQGSLTSQQWEDKKAKWQLKQEMCSAAIKTRLGLNARNLVEDLSNTSKILQTLEDFYRPQGSGALTDLDSRFDDISLATCKDIGEFAEKVREIDHGFKELGIHFPEPLLVQKFLKGLGPGYSVFRTTFNQTSNLLPGPGGIKATTFEETFRKALNEERYQQTTEQLQAKALVAQGLALGKRKIDVDFCEHCQRPYHTDKTCWILHPELKKSRDN